MDEVTPVKRGEEYRWTSDGVPQPGAFRTDGSVVESLPVNLVSMTVSLGANPVEAPGVEVVFTVDLDTYTALESKRWFGIPVGFAGWKIGGFEADAPVEVTARYRTSGPFFPLNLFTMGTHQSELLAKLLAPLVDPSVFGPTRNPMNFEAVRVLQRKEGGARGFDHADIADFETGRPSGG